jgi:hypothetical protein
MTNKYWQKMRHRRWPRTAHPACQASRCALTGQRASIAGNGSGRLVGCSPPRYGVHTPADGTAQPKISQPPAPSAGGSGSPLALPEPGIPGSNPGPQAGEPQRHRHGSSAAGSQDLYPERAASVINLPGETHPARRTISGYASADIPRKIPESAMVPHRFGREPVACRLAAGQPSSATTASPAWGQTNSGESASKASGICRQETMSFVRKRRNARASRTSA